MTLQDDEFLPLAPDIVPRKKPWWTSPSRLSNFSKCPRKYEFKEVKKLPTRPAPNLDLGANVHAALRDWMRLKPSARTWEALLEFYRDAWRKNRPYFLDKPREELREWGERGKTMLRRFSEEVPGDLEPIMIEKSVGIDFEGIRVGGKVDRVDLLPDGSLRVIDYKTGVFPKRPDLERAQDLAAAVYARGASTDMVGAPVVEVEYLYLDTMERLTFPIDDAWQLQREVAIEGTARALLAAEQSGDFPATPTALCAWCDFRERCPEGQAFLDARAGRG